MKRLLFFQLFVLWNLIFSFAQPGSLDLTFNPNDIGNGIGDGALLNTVINDVAVQPDGKILLVGDFNIFNSNSLNSKVVRIEEDGAIDYTFSFYSLNSGQLCALQQNGKILIVSKNSLNQYYIYRINSDGSQDFTFSYGSGASGAIRAIAIQSDGKILVGGDFTSYNGTACSRIIRLNTDGSIDNTFNVGTGANNSVYAIAITATNKILVGGSFTQFNGTNKNAVVHLNNDGSLATTQFNGFTSGSTVKTILLESNGNIVFGGQFITYSGNTSYDMVRVNGSGTYDNTFVSGFSLPTEVTKIIKSPSGHYLVCGNITSYSGNNVNHFVCINNDGSFNSGFYYGVFNGSVNTIALHSNNKVIVGGSFVKFDNYEVRGLIRLNADGTRDVNFNPNSGFNNVTRSIAVLPNKKMIVGGDFTLYNGKIVNYLIRIHENGQLDTTFNINNPGPDNNVYKVLVQPDQKILIGGNFNSYNGVIRNKIARLNADGSLDQSFNPGSAANGIVYDMLLQDDGKIIVVGDFTTFNGITVNRIVRLNPNGSIDLTFNPGSGANSQIVNIVAYQNGKYLIGGSFTTYNNISVNYLARINHDGSLDPTFNIGSGPNSFINCLLVQNDGKIYVGGNFTSFNGTNVHNFIRLNTDGSIDATFNQGVGFIGTVYNVLLLNDGSILVSGNFDTYNSTFRPGLVKLSPNGMLNPYFNGGYASKMIRFMVQQGQGRIIIGGEFVNYNEVGRNRIARIFDCDHTTNTINVDACDSYTAPDGQVYTSSGTYTAIIPNATGCDSIITINLTVKQSSSVITSYYVCNENSFTAPDGQVYTSSGTYTAIIPNAAGCDSIITFHLIFVTFEAQAILSNDTLIASPDYGGYQWVDCNNNYAPIPGAVHLTFVPATSGSYAVIISTMECNEDTSACVNVILQNTSLSHYNSFNVYPNPAFDKLFIHGNNASDIISYEIIDMVGQVVEKGNLKDNVIIIEKLKPNFYTLKVSTQNTTFNWPFIKQ